MKSRSTLMGMTKAELVDEIECLCHNIDVKDEQINNQAKLLERWKPERYARWVESFGDHICSVCGCGAAEWEADPDNPEGLPPYCHCCGARMDGGAGDE